MKTNLKNAQPIGLLNIEKMKRREQFRRKKERLLSNKRKNSEIDLTKN